MRHADSSDVGYSWPPPPAPEAIEWPGTPIGRSNVVTRTKSRTAVHDKSLDRDPEARDALLARARDYAARDNRARTHDVIIHGVRVRATTNMPHLLDFWVDNWFGVDEWERLTGRPAPARPQVQVYALGEIPGEQVAAYYSRERNAIVFFNSSYYGQLKSWVLGAVGRILAAEYGIHSVHGAAVEAAGRGILFIAPTGTGKSTSSYGLMRVPGSSFHSDDWVYIRYALPLRDGTPVMPYRAREAGGREVRGFRVLPWLLADPGARANLDVLTLDDGKLTVSREDLDTDAPLQAHAYISEKQFYLRSNLTESFVSSAPELLRSKMENVPDVGETFLAGHHDTLARALSELDHTVLGSPEEVKRQLARLIAFDNARAMLDISRVFGEERVYTNPLRPLALTSVFLLRRDPEDRLVLRRLTREQFATILARGRTPVGTFETAYNAYRAVDDAVERAYIEPLLKDEESETAERRILDELLSPEAPESLLEEFTLFSLLFRAAACYELNTALRSDPAVRDTREAVQRTLALLERVTRESPADIRLDLDNYASYLT